MEFKHPVINEWNLRLFYFAFASFSLGIAIQETTLLLFLFSQMALVVVFQRTPGTLYNKGRRLALLFMVVMTLSALISQLRIPIEGPTRIHWAFAAFWGVSLFLMPRINWVTLYRVVLIVSIPGLLYSIYWLLQPAEIAHSLNIGFHSYPRAAGLVSNPITNAEGLVIFACWSLGRLTGEIGPRERKLILIHLIISILIILFSRVRAGLVGLTIILALYATFFPRWRKITIWTLVIMTGVFLGSILLFGFNLASLEERIELMSNSVTLITRYPIVGIGPNNFGNYPIEGSTLMEHPHNSILGIAVEFGLVGLTAYLIFMGSVAYNLFRLRKLIKDPTSPLRWVALSLTLAFIAYWVFGLFDYNFADSELLILHSFQWAMITQLAIYHDDGPSQERSPPAISEPEAV